VPGESLEGKLALPVLLYFTPIVRIFEFTVGIGLAFLIRRVMDANLSLTRLQWLAIELGSIFIISIGMFAAANLAGIRQTLGDPATYHFTASGLWLFWSLLIGVFALSRGPIKIVFSTRFAVFLGEISFSLYLCHALLINYLENYKDHVLSYGTLGYTVFWIWCLSFAALLFIGIETPFRKLILAIAAKKISVKDSQLAVRACFGWKELLAMLTLAGMALALIFLRPSTIFALDDSKVIQFNKLSAEQLNLSGKVTFNNKYEILGVRVEADSRIKNTAEILVLMRVKETLHATDTLALHTIAADGQMTGGFDRRLDTGRLSIPAGTRWIQKFVVPKDKFNQSASLGLAMYTTPAKLFDAVGGNRDWGGTRLILPIQH
jgi:hypothetical protein